MENTQVWETLLLAEIKIMLGFVLLHLLHHAEGWCRAGLVPALVVGAVEDEEDDEDDDGM